MTPLTAGSTLTVALLLWIHLTAAADLVASTARQTMASAPQQPQAPPATLVGHDGAAMRLVPAGEFLMGSPDPNKRAKDQNQRRGGKGKGKGR